MYTSGWCKVEAILPISLNSWPLRMCTEQLALAHVHYDARAYGKNNFHYAGATAAQSRAVGASVLS